MGEAGSFGGDALEDVVDERVHDAHGLAGDTNKNTIRTMLLLADYIQQSQTSLLQVQWEVFIGKCFSCSILLEK